MIEGPAPAAPARSPGRWVSALVVVLALAAGAAAAAVWPSDSPPSDPPPRAAASAPLTASAGAGATAPAAGPRPAAGAPVSERQAWVTREVTAMVRDQSQRLLAGDLAGFSAVAAAGDRAAGRDLRRRFDNLRALRVARFDQQLEGQPRLLDAKQGRWRVVLVAGLCFVDNDCAPDLAMYDTIWKETPRGLRFTAFARHDRREKCIESCRGDVPILVRPWETTDLAVQFGARTLVAVPTRHRGRLPDLTARADAAAALADRYVVGGTPVDRYRVFVADDAAWRTWYTGFPGRWVAGRALPTGPNSVEVTVLLRELTPGYADTLLRHELAHVATLRSTDHYGEDDVWWLVEGMAEYVQQSAGAGPYAKLPALRAFLRSGRLRSVRVAPPAPSASDTDAAGRYAVGYYALTHLMTTYGRAPTLRFFQQAVQYGLGLDTAARTAFGKPWSRLDEECAAAVRRVPASRDTPARERAGNR